MSRWIIEINPDIVAIGFDEHPRSMKKTKADRPSSEKIIGLLSKLKDCYPKNPEKKIYLNGEVAKIYFEKKRNRG